MGKSIPSPPADGKGRLQPGKARGSPQLIITIDGDRQAIDPAKLANEMFADKLKRRCERARQPAIVNLDNLLDLADPLRFAALDFIAGLPRSRVVVGEKAYADLFQAMLAFRLRVNNVGHVRNFKLAALEAAVLLFPDALDVACGRIADRMRNLKIRGVRTAGLIQDAARIKNELAKAASRSLPTGPVNVREILPDAPVGADATVPPGWGLSADGISRVADQHPGVQIPAPLLIQGRCLEVSRDEELFAITWLRDGSWRSRIVERSVLADARSVTRLAACGMPVTSNNAKLVVQYVAEYETENLKRLPASHVSHQLGWQGPVGKHGFLLGDSLVTSERIVKTGSNSDVPESPASAIQFIGADEGDRQIALGFHAAGTLSAWIESIKPLAGYPRVRLGIYASFAAPMLMILRARNIILDYAGENTSGKTTTLRVAGSVWGSPNENDAKGGTVVYTWDATAVWRERAPATLNNLPFILDDTKRARRREDVEQTIYDVAQGRARGRGSPKGLASQATWQTVGYFSGEQSATSFSEAGGTRARVLTIWGSPFGVRDQKIGALTRRLNSQLRRHYGHAGPRFVRYLLANRKKWGAWRKEFRAFVEKYEKLAGANPLAGRLAEDFAAIHLTAKLVHQAIKLPWAFADPIAPLREELVREAGEADRAAAALRHVMGWATAHQSEFFQRGAGMEGNRQPHCGWAGVWPAENPPAVFPTLSKKTVGWDMIGFIPHRLVDVLRDGGFEPDPVIRTWKDRQWLKGTKEKSGTVRNRIKVKIGGRSDWVIGIKRSAIAEAEKG